MRISVTRGLVSGMRLENCARRGRETLTRGTLSRDDKRIRMSLNERMGMLTGYERTFLTLVPAIKVTTDREDAPVEELAQDSVGRWRMALARDLNSVARTLGQNFQMKPEASENEGLSSEN